MLKNQSRMKIVTGNVYRGLYIVDSLGEEAVYIWPEDVRELIKQLRQFSAHQKLVKKKLNKRVWQTKTKITAVTQVEVITK